MEINHRFRSGVRGRAKVVCRHCHARKVKCDLQSRVKGTCSNCQKYGLTCELRTSRRVNVGEKYTKGQAATPPESNESPPQNPCLPPTPGENAENQQIDNHVVSAVSHSQLHRQYIGGIVSVISGPPSLPSGLARTSAFSTNMAQEIIRMTGAAEAPPRILFNASADLYFDHVFYRIPVFDRVDVDVETPHIAIQQAICMIGAMMRYPKGPNILEDNDMYYFKTKTLMHNSFAQDPITNLKVLALLSTRNVVGPVVCHSDCSWYWLGIAIRTLQQIGLHKEAVCAKILKPGTARRIAWCFFTLDKLASASLGRPTALKENEFDVQPVTLEDFEIANIQALLFIERTKLALILGRILDLRSRPSDLADNQQKDIYYSLRNWVDTLPLEARLFDGDKQRPYHHGIHELYILYFATIITFLYSFNDSDINSVPNIISLVASSCMVRLYHELDIRDDVNYLLTVHMWLFMLAAMPQLLYNAAEGLSEADRRACSDALDKLVSALGQFMIKIPGAETMLNTINRLRAQDHPVHPTSTSREWRKHNLNGELHSVLAFRDLFPFPLSLSPRLELLDQLGDMRSVASPPPDINEDLGWILEEFADISTFTGWPSM